MSDKGRTPDEKFLIKLYQEALAKGDPCLPIEFPNVARSLGLRETAIKNIIKHLAQCNFLKKVNDTTLFLTDLGCRFVLDEID